jgi:hypothetical protein
MTESDHSRQFDGMPMTSGLPPGADIVTDRRVSKVPFPEVIVSSAPLPSQARHYGPADVQRPSSQDSAEFRSAPGALERFRQLTSRFATSSPLSKVTPVIFAPGRLKFATKPIATGSAAFMKTIGIVVVADFAANAERGCHRQR